MIDVMAQVSGHTKIGLAVAFGFLLAAEAVPLRASAFDVTDNLPKESGRSDIFRFGFRAYKSGDKDKAVEAYRYAAEQGHTGSRWALANMYAFGDGVAENDYEAFKIYTSIVSEDVEPGSPDTGFYINALMALANYYYSGIPDSPVKRDLAQARQLYFQAASVFGFPEAQFRLAQMLLKGEGGPENTRFAKKWLNLARQNGNVGAMAVFGNLIFNEGQPVIGLAYLTTAVKRCRPSDCAWIRELQEKCFSIADESSRSDAIALAQNMSTSTP